MKGWGQEPSVAAGDNQRLPPAPGQRKDENALLINTDYVQTRDISTQPSTPGPPGQGEPKPSRSWPLPTSTAWQQCPGHTDPTGDMWSQTSCSKCGVCPCSQPRGATVAAQPHAALLGGSSEWGAACGGSRGCPRSVRAGTQHRASLEVLLCPPASCPLPATGAGGQFLGCTGWLTITCTT